MSWLKFHTKSEEYASQAEMLYQRHKLIAGAELYRLAAGAEVEALNSLDRSKTRTLGITVVSAASLYFKVQDFDKAKEIACEWLESKNSEHLPTFAIKELKHLLRIIYLDELVNLTAPTIKQPQQHEETVFTKNLFSQPLLSYENSLHFQKYSLPSDELLHNKKILQL
jgi:hypothetical protein